MKIAIFLSALAVAAAMGAPSTLAKDGNRTIQYRCDDLVIIGRIKNHSYTHVEIEDDLLGHGIIEMEVRIKKFLRGRTQERIVRATTFAHTYLREDRDFLMVLAPKSDGIYQLRMAALRRTSKPHSLSAQCTAQPTST